jgi:hypothetical protein
VAARSDALPLFVRTLTAAVGMYPSELHKENARLLVLDFSCNPDMGCGGDPAVLASAITSVPVLHTLVTLDLTMTGLRALGVAALAQSLAKAASGQAPMALENLLLGDNEIGRQQPCSAAGVATARKDVGSSHQQPQPSASSSSSCREGIQFLARALRAAAFPRLRVLDLSRNELSASVIRPLCTLLEQCSLTLTRLSLRDNRDAVGVGGGLEALVAVALKRRNGLSLPSRAVATLDLVVGAEAAAAVGGRQLDGQLCVRVTP